MALRASLRSVARGGVILSDYLDDYLKLLKQLDYSKNTIESYSRYLNLLQNISHTKYKKNVYELKFSQLVEIKKTNLSKYAKSTQNTIFAMLKSFEDYLLAEGVIDFINITNLIYQPTYKNYARSFSSADVKRIINIASSAEVAAGFIFLIMTGMRISELKNFDKKDLMLDENKIYIQASKNHKERAAPLLLIEDADIALHYIESYEVIFGEATPFSDTKHKIRYLIDTYNKKYNKNFYTHHTRATYATNLVKKGYRLDQIKTYLGHENLKTTLKYIDSRED